MAHTIAQDVSHLVFTEIKFRLFQNNDQFIAFGLIYQMIIYFILT